MDKHLDAEGIPLGSAKGKSDSIARPRCLCDMKSYPWMASGGPQMTNEKDREEARKLAKILGGSSSYVFDIGAGVRFDQAVKEVANIRADERRRCAELAETERITPENTDGALLCEEDHAYNRAIDHVKSAILQGTEPSKVSEDVNKDIETVDEVLLEYENKSIKEIRSAVAAFRRLVACLKEGR